MSTKQTQRSNRKASATKGSKGVKVLAHGRTVAQLGSRQAARRFIRKCYNYYLEHGGKGRKASRLVEVPARYRAAFKVQSASMRSGASH